MSHIILNLLDLIPLLTVAPAEAHVRFFGVHRQDSMGSGSKLAGTMQSVCLCMQVFILLGDHHVFGFRRFVLVNE
jgi:hypothetical protein